MRLDHLESTKIHGVYACKINKKKLRENSTLP